MLSSCTIFVMKFLYKYIVLDKYQYLLLSYKIALLILITDIFYHLSTFYINKRIIVKINKKQCL